MWREVIAVRFANAARLGHQHGREAGRAAARGLVNLGSAAVTIALLLGTIMVVTLLWFLLLYAWFILLGGMLGALASVWELLSACWPFFTALGVLLLALRLCWFPAASTQDLAATPHPQTGSRPGRAGASPRAAGPVDEPATDGPTVVPRPDPI